MSQTCLCGAPLVRQTGKGRKSHYCSARCRKRAQSQREQATVTKNELPVTKMPPVVPPHPVCQTWYRGYLEKHIEAETGAYDTSGNYWCEHCTAQRIVMNNGKLLGWPEVYFWPESYPIDVRGLMIRAGETNWRTYLRSYGNEIAQGHIERTCALLEQQKEQSV